MIFLILLFNIIILGVLIVSMFYPVAYLGFHKGRQDFRWPLVLTQVEGQTMFTYFFLWAIAKKNFCQRGPWPNGPPKYTTDCTSFDHFINACFVETEPRRCRMQQNQIRTASRCSLDRYQSQWMTMS